MLSLTMNAIEGAPVVITLVTVSIAVAPAVSVSRMVKPVAMFPPAAT